MTATSPTPTRPATSRLVVFIWLVGCVLAGVIGVLIGGAVGAVTGLCTILVIAWFANAPNAASETDARHDGMTAEVEAVFASTEVAEVAPDPSFGDDEFPPPLARGELDEATVRMFYPALEMVFYEYHPQLHLCPVANAEIPVEFAENETGSFDFRTNSIGMHGRREPSETQPDLRVLLTGASNVQGVCENHETIPALLEEALGTDRPNDFVEVLNAGCGSYNFYNYLAVLERHVDLAPDVFVIVAYTGNDFFGGVKQWRYFRGLGAAAGGPCNPELLLESDDSFERQLLGLEIGQAVYALNNPDDENTALCVACSTIVAMQQVCRQRGVELICACVPSPLAGQPGRMAATRRSVEHRLGMPATAIDVSDRIADSWLAFLADRGITACDLRPEFRAAREPLYLAIDGHLNLNGKERVAQAIGRCVENASRSTD